MILRKTAAIALPILGMLSAARAETAANVIHPRIMSWLYSGTRAVRIEDSNGQWYRVDLAADCASLKTAVDVSVRSPPPGKPQLLTGGAACDIARITPVSDTSLYPTPSRH
jgi:hypothetical protein